MIDYLFICGVGRSGTTYLRKVINDIDGVLLTFESTVLHQLFALLEDGEELNARKTQRKLLPQKTRLTIQNFSQS